VASLLAEHQSHLRRIFASKKLLHIFLESLPELLDSAWGIRIEYRSNESRWVYKDGV
jgi:hypothetical protein